MDAIILAVVAVHTALTGVVAGMVMRNGSRIDRILELLMGHDRRITRVEESRQ